MARYNALALLSCRSPFLDDTRVYCPLANLYLKSYLQAQFPALQIVIMDDAYDVNALDALEQFDIIGISIMTPQRQEALSLARAIKQRWPYKTIVAGGPHVTFYGSDLLPEASFDFLVQRDGEKCLSRILGGDTVPRLLMDPLSRQEVLLQPRPDRTSANSRDIIARYRYLLRDRLATTMMTARGCPEQCTFCEDAMTQVRWSSLYNISQEFYDIRNLGFTAVYIFDDLFAMSLSKIRPICDELAHLDMIYRCNVQARYFTKWGDEMARLLASTGCHEIAFGAESGSQSILNNVRKRCTVEQNFKTVEYAKKHGLLVKVFILLGLPGETYDTLRETELFINSSGIDDFQCVVYMPFKGTQIRTALDRGEPIDLRILPKASDNEITGAYATKGGITSSEVRTASLSAKELDDFRNYLVSKYRPASHRLYWQTDRFFDQHQYQLS